MNINTGNTKIKRDKLELQIEQKYFKGSGETLDVQMFRQDSPLWSESRRSSAGIQGNCVLD